MATLVKVTRSGQITIPAAIRQALNLREGDYVEVSLADDRIILTPKQVVDKSQAYFWTAEWQAAEREADEDIRAGRVRVFESVEELLADLEAE
ncbi:MAG TPA: AbrB/MazE/SpoVT family DNA-binding domain-containing protein [Anaerolineae bacterium]|nr:AbrB/MazE/SpoVT family DNA-binding domain-containing protein [Anaerolineae bacterium]